MTLDGRYHQVRDAVLAPAPTHHVPVLIAAFGPRMLRLTARHADAWNTAWYGAADDRLRTNVTAFDDAVAAEGRDPAYLMRTVGMVVNDPAHPVPDDDEDSSFDGSVDDLAVAIDEYEAHGIDHLIVSLQRLTESSLDRLAQALGRRAGIA